MNPSPPPQTCRICGCTDEIACETPDGPCHWVEPDLCSACAGLQPVLALTPADIKALELAPEIGIKLNACTSFMLLGVLQLADRHPDLSDDSRATLRRFAGILETHVSKTDNLARLARAGWRKNDAPPKLSTLILPDGTRIT